MIMDCETFRERVAADPAELDADCADHAESCVACAAFGERVRNAEWLIQEALRFDVAAMKAGTERKAPLYRMPTAWRFGAAAALVAVFAVWLGVASGPDPDAQLLVAEVIEHWHEEPGSWVTTDVRISPASLEEVTAGNAAVDAAGLGLVSYARSCFVRDRWVPHLVVQGEEGPVMLLLLPHESVAEPLPLDLPEEGLQGVILPVGAGSIAVLGTDGEPLEPIRQRISDSVEWSI